MNADFPQRLISAKLYQNIDISSRVLKAISYVLGWASIGWAFVVLFSIKSMAYVCFSGSITLNPTIAMGLFALICDGLGKYVVNPAFYSVRCDTPPSRATNRR